MPNHTGKSIAEAVYTVLDDYILIKKIGCITIDNASNNVKFFDILLENNGYQFSIQNKQIKMPMPRYSVGGEQFFGRV